MVSLVFIKVFRGELKGRQAGSTNSSPRRKIINLQPCGRLASGRCCFTIAPANHPRYFFGTNDTQVAWFMFLIRTDIFLVLTHCSPFAGLLFAFRRSPPSLPSPSPLWRLPPTRSTRRIVKKFRLLCLCFLSPNSCTLRCSLCFSNPHIVIVCAVENVRALASNITVHIF